MSILTNLLRIKLIFLVIFRLNQLKIYSVLKMVKVFLITNQIRLIKLNNQQIISLIMFLRLVWLVVNKMEIYLLNLISKQLKNQPFVYLISLSNKQPSHQLLIFLASLLKTNNPQSLSLIQVHPKHPHS